jgi:hypothetical protein
MRIDIDLDTNVWLAGPSLKYGIQEVPFKRDTASILEVRFWRSGAIVELDAGAAGKFGIKTAGEYDSTPLAQALSWTKVGTEEDTVYQFAPTLDSEALAAALGHGNGETDDDLASIEAMAEILWIVDGKKYRTQTVPVRIANDILKDEDGTPLALPTPEEWLAERTGPIYLIEGNEPSKRRLIITGGFYTGGETPVTWSPLIERDAVNGKSRFASEPGSTEFEAQWEIAPSAQWVVSGPFGIEWTSDEDVATPDLVNEWTPAHPSLAEITIELLPSLPGITAGRHAYMGTEAPYRIFEAVEIDEETGTVWQEITPGVIWNATQSKNQRLTISGTAGNEIINIENL